MVRWQMGRMQLELRGRDDGEVGGVHESHFKHRGRNGARTLLSRGETFDRTSLQH